MAIKYEAYAYVDLTALRDSALDDGVDDCAIAESTRESHGKILLMLTSLGIELVRVPPILH